MTYEYDLSHSRSSTPPPTPPHFKLKHALPHHSSSKHSPSRAYDISCILDPTYASGSSSSQSSSSPSSAFVDTHGDLHDPDYRPFAPYATTNPTAKRRSAPGGGINVDHHWDTASDDDDADSDDDGNASAHGSDNERLHRHHRFATYNHPHLHQHHPRQHDRSRSQSGSRTRHASPRRYVPYYEQPFATTTVLSSSPEEDDVAPAPYVTVRRAEEDPFVDGFGYDDERKGRRLLKTRRFSRRSEKRKSKDQGGEVEKRVVVRAPTPYQFDLDEEPETGLEDLIATQPEWTPTCTQSIRRQWQAISLSLRFSIFRARRRLRRKLLNK
ncbi:hypothetical protein NEOLEDRAFT_1183499 [Neolentinus lepideus HHB14362 ss-1]|uniref:Uncharacterized protein n=1 Tax=Neolentinus lepideus HHB14362 ss-1 TaxID=1314782 RepID=A0A165N9A0_9AGAM|nr:hypothetical protein NEOLEDRAFT_1183499 [Neolentinus lepideus HHB14362 ss-1]